MKHCPNTHNTESWISPTGAMKNAIVVRTQPKTSIDTALYTVMFSFLSRVMALSLSEVQQDDEHCDNGHTNG